MMTLENSPLMVVDDSEVNTLLLKAILEAEGYPVLVEHDAQVVVAAVKRRRPALILLDVMMPGLNGMELLQILKRDPTTASIPVIMVTAVAEGIEVFKALEAGAFDYIRKPLEAIEVVARIRSAIRYQAQQDKLLEMASRDGLTGLYNHHLLMDLLTRELAVNHRKGVSLTFCMADIDHFKAVNDTHGHPVGDLVLQEISRLLAQGVRKSDLVGRYGGEEFGLILVACDAAKAARLCERLRARIARAVFGPEGARFSLTLSLGIAEVQVKELISAADLVSKADKALYLAKTAGRDRIVLA